MYSSSPQTLEQLVAQMRLMFPEAKGLIACALECAYIMGQRDLASEAQRKLNNQKTEAA